MKKVLAVVLLAGLVVNSLSGAEKDLAKKMEELQRAKNNARKEMVDCFKRIKNVATAEAEAPAIKKAYEQEFQADLGLMNLSRENPESDKLVEAVLDKLDSELRDVESSYQKEMKRLSGKEDIYKVVKQAMTVDAPPKPTAGDTAPDKPAQKEKPAKADQ